MPPRCFDSAQGPGSSEQARAPEGPGEEEEGPSSQGSEGGPGGPQEEERPGDRAHEETAEAGAGKRGRGGEALSSIDTVDIKIALTHPMKSIQEMFEKGEAPPKLPHEPISKAAI